MLSTAMADRKTINWVSLLPMIQMNFRLYSGIGRSPLQVNHHKKIKQIRGKNHNTPFIRIQEMF